MNAIASFTGGVAYYGRNDLDVAMREALDDGRISYTLGFYQPGDDPSPGIHRLAVEVNRPGVILRYRTIYQTRRAQPVSGDWKTDALRVLNLPADAAAIPIKLFITPGSDRLSLRALLDVASLDLVHEHGVWTGKVKVVARFADAVGRLAGEGWDQTLTLNLHEATYDKAAEAGLRYDFQLEVPKGASELKLLFMDLSTHKIVTVTVPLSEVDKIGTNPR
jgi:hypothetical protein